MRAKMLQDVFLDMSFLAAHHVSYILASESSRLSRVQVYQTLESMTLVHGDLMASSTRKLIFFYPRLNSLYALRAPPVYQISDL